MNEDYWELAFWIRDRLVDEEFAPLSVQLNQQFLANNAIGPFLNAAPLDGQNAALCSQMAKASAIAALQERVFLKELSAKLSENPLETLLVKGGGLSYHLYPEPWMRPKTDFDFWVSPRQCKEFADIIKMLGFRELPTLQGVSYRQQATFLKTVSPGFDLQVDLHQSLFERPSLRKLCEFESIWAERQALANFKGLWIPGDMDHLWIVIQHFLGHHPNELRLIWLVDAILLTQKIKQSDGNWPAKWFQDPLFKSFFDWFEGFLTGNRSPWIAQSPSQVQRFLSDLSTVSWRERLLYLKEVLFPPVGYMRSQGKGWLPWLYLKRMLRAIKFLKKPVGPHRPKH